MEVETTGGHLAVNYTSARILILRAEMKLLAAKVDAAIAVIMVTSSVCLVLGTDIKLKVIAVSTCLFL